MSTPDLPGDHSSGDPQTHCVPGQPLASDHRHPATQAAFVAGEPSDPTTCLANPIDRASGQPLPGDHPGSAPRQRGTVTGHHPTTSHTPFEPHRSSAGGRPLSDDQSTRDTHSPAAAADTSAADHVAVEPHATRVGGTLSTPPTRAATTTSLRASAGWLELRVWAEMFNDSQLARIAAKNRAERGGVDAAPYEPYTDALVVAEHVCELGLHRCYRRVVPPSIVAWQKDNAGVGEHLMSRLLGHLGHPRYATPHHWEGTGTNRALYADEPYERTLAQLWQYCGHGDPARRVKKGMTADELAGLGKPDLKMIVHLIADRAVLEPGRSVDLLLTGDQHPDEAQRYYRKVYEQRRLVTAERLHATECVRCGPSGKPAAVLTPWSKAHQQADALRIVGKELLRDLWTVAT